MKPGFLSVSNGPDDCAVYGAKGEPRGKVKPQGDWPALQTGTSPMEFSYEPSADPKPRARVTVFARGETL